MAKEQYAREAHARDAAVERLWTHTVGIANRALATEGRDPTSGLMGKEHEQPGTAVAGIFESRHFLLTAGHVLDEAKPSDLSFFARPAGAFKRVAHPSEVTLNDGFFALPHADEGTAAIYRCPWEDIALVTVEPGSLGPYLEFADLSSSVDPNEKETVVGLGFPVSNAFIFERRIGPNLQKAVLLAPIAFSGEVLPSATGRYFKDFDSERHYLIPYEATAEGKHPKGISGAAVWAQSNEKQIVWTASFKFAGICTSCYKDGNLEKIVKASTVRRFLIETFRGHL